MNRTLPLIGIVVLIILVCISGCQYLSGTQRIEADRFIGTWIEERDASFPRIIFFSDQTCSFGIKVGTYNVTDGKLRVEFSNGASSTYEYEFQDDNRLFLREIGSRLSEVYTRQ